MEGEDADARGQEAAPEDGGGVEGDPLLHREQQAPDGRSKRGRHACVIGESLSLKSCASGLQKPGCPAEELSQGRALIIDVVRL